MKIVLIYSGGLDSTVLLYHLLAEQHHVSAIIVNYGQRHVREIESAQAICQQLSVEYRLADIRSVVDLFGNNSLTNKKIDVAEGHYQAETMKTTVVPNRNMLFLSLASAWAISIKADCVAYGAHAGDHAIYPDCREPFAQAMDQAIRLADWHEVFLHRPFINFSKTDIIKRGAELEVPFAQTWSCYKGGDTHCGKCGTCVERREAFELAGINDPTRYEKKSSHPSLIT